MCRALLAPMPSRALSSRLLALLVPVVFLTASQSGAEITQIIDDTGDGLGNALNLPISVALDSGGNVYVVGQNSDNAFKITPGGAITEIIDSTGDGLGNTLNVPSGVAVDFVGNVYVTGQSNNAFRINAPGTCSTTGTPCTITEIIDSTGDGLGNTLGATFGVTVDSSGNVYVAGSSSHNAFKISAPSACGTTGTPCTIAEIIDTTGDSLGNTLVGPFGVAVDSGGNVYIAGVPSQNAFKITPGGTITEIIDSTGDGLGNTLVGPLRVAVDSSGNVYVAGQSNNAFRISTPDTCSTTGTPCTITEIIDSTGDGLGNILDNARDVTVDSRKNIYVAGSSSHNAFKIFSPGTCSTTGGPCTIQEIIDSTGDGLGNTLGTTLSLTVDSSGNVYVTGGGFTNNAFKIDAPPPAPALSSWGVSIAAALLALVALAASRWRRVPA